MSILFPSFYFLFISGYAPVMLTVNIKCSTKFLSGIVLIHVSGDFFLSGNVGNVSVQSFVSCVVLLLATTKFAVMFAPEPRRDPAHLSDRYSDFQHCFCRFSDSD